MLVSRLLVLLAAAGLCAASAVLQQSLDGVHFDSVGRIELEAKVCLKHQLHMRMPVCVALLLTQQLYGPCLPAGWQHTADRCFAPGRPVRASSPGTDCLGGVWRVGTLDPLCPQQLPQRVATSLLAAATAPSTWPLVATRPESHQPTASLSTHVNAPLPSRPLMGRASSAGCTLYGLHCLARRL
jgi:hypothetical protein